MGVYRRVSAWKVSPTSDWSRWRWLVDPVAAVSLAGHWGLDNLILIYDNNNVTVDGSIDSCFTDDTSAKFRAQNWNVIDVYDGSNDVGGSSLGSE